MIFPDSDGHRMQPTIDKIGVNILSKYSRAVWDFGFLSMLNAKLIVFNALF
jgi:hypothetical protein